MIKTIRSLALLSLIAAAALVAFWLMAGRPSQAQSDQGILASLISRLLSTPTTQVTIGRIEGALSSNAVIRDIRIADKDGVWLNLDRARLVWSRTAAASRWTSSPSTGFRSCAAPCRPTRRHLSPTNRSCPNCRSG